MPAGERNKTNRELTRPLTLSAAAAPRFNARPIDCMFEKSTSPARETTARRPRRLDPGHPRTAVPRAPVRSWIVYYAGGTFGNSRQILRVLYVLSPTRMERNAERVRYPKLRAQNLSIGSGVVEAAGMPAGWAAGLT